jgi:hypothetical protein
MIYTRRGMCLYVGLPGQPGRDAIRDEAAAYFRLRQ